MSVYSTQPDRMPEARGGDFDWPPQVPPQPARKRVGIIVLFLALLTLAVLCVAGFLVIRLFAPDSLAALLGQPASGGQGAGYLTSEGEAGRAQVTLNPPLGLPGTLVTVTGHGWQPGEPVFVFLRPYDDPQGQGFSYAAGVANADGDLQAAFTFPTESRWQGASWADVIARGTRSGREATVRFGLILPTVTRTLPPTVGPTQAPTQTPTPTRTPSPTPAPLPSPTPTPPIITAWRGEYYVNPALAGDPALVRNDDGVNFDWGLGSPAPGLPADEFSARWTRWLYFEEGVYRFTLRADDGVRLWIDGDIYVDQWRVSPFTTYEAEPGLAEGMHWMQVEYFEAYGSARIDLSWARLLPTETPAPTQTPTASPAPTATETPTATPEPSPWPAVPWQAQYYANPELDGDPVLVREDAAIDFDWGTGSPGEGLPKDHFSARWYQELPLARGTYRIRVTVDDGVRIWLDGTAVIDEWLPTGGADYSTLITLEEAVHLLMVEYFEDSGKALIRYQLELISGG